MSTRNEGATQSQERELIITCCSSIEGACRFAGAGIQGNL